MFLVNNVSERDFKDRYYNSEFGIRVYFISIGWVLSQTEIPNKIEYIASIDNFDIGKNRNIYCMRCKYDTEFWVKRIFTKTDYKIINIFPCCGRRESQYVECERCGSLDTPLSEMEKNGEILCKSCIT
jgi:formylmethanofuran dehydrogenase subunit E